jgi:hypothetical protein
MAEKQKDVAYRHALYYPYIHIRDENWLKGTLLGFQQVRRIVPNQFTLKDQAITKPYEELKGPDGQPLLQPVLIDSYQIRESQEWLRHKILTRIDLLVALYSEASTPVNWQGGPEAFEMHVGKILYPELLELLTTKSLAWYSREPGEQDSPNWVTMHPKFGSAVMSILALSIARLEGLSVVTPSGHAHHELLANREEQVFEKLLDVPLAPGAAPDADVTVEELAHVVITTGFDLTRLTPAQISELLKDGKDLRAFHGALADFVSRIPPGMGPEERTAQLKKEAQLVLDEWAKYTALLPHFAKEALVDSALDKAPDVIKEGITVGVLATVLSWPTLLISVGVAAGIKMFRKHDTPLRFLSRVDKAVDRSIGSIYVPQWTKLGGQSAI